MIHLTVAPLEIPFKHSFKHASAERSVTEAVIAIARSDKGIIGYGEGCPRRYVTQETIDSAIYFFETHQAAIQQICGIHALKDWVSCHRNEIDANPAAWCAIEMALLDLFGKEEGISIDALLGLPELHGNFTYSAVLGITSPKVFQAQLQQYLHLGLADFKIKLSGNEETDRSNIDVLRSLEGINIRADANNCWLDSAEAARYLRLLNYPFWAIEEPLSTGDYAGCKILAEQLNTHIILDESFLRIEQLEYLKDKPDLWILNIRISKMGGLLRSLEIAEAAKRNGLSFILGAQVGETSLLTRAALSVANNYCDNLLAQEGAFGTYLLERDVIDQPIMFRERGIVTIDTITSYGLGIDYTL